MKTLLKKHIVGVMMVLIMTAISKTNAQEKTFCFTPQVSKNLNLYKSSLARTAVKDAYCLKIYVHVIRKSNSTGGQSVADVYKALKYLDDDYNPHGITFQWDNTIDYINNDTYYSTPTTTIYTVNNHTDGIDIYLFDDTSAAGGRANGVGESSEFWVSGTYWKTPANSLVKSSVISHEMGHVLFLWHTFHGTVNEGGSDTSQCKELVNSSNGNTCGDYVKDTPADPHLQFNVNYPACEWSGSGTDANGDNYNPDTELIMSYTNPSCMSKITNGQGQRIRNSIATLPHLQKATVNCPDCPINLTINQNVYSNTVSFKSASNTLTAINKVYNNGKAIYNAGKHVRLKSGFNAKPGSTFRGYVKNCSASSLFDNDIELDHDILNSFSKIKVHPNPTKNSFNIETDEAIESWSLLNAFGRSYFKGKTKDKIINVQHLKKGIYILQFVLKDGTIITKKVIKE